MLFRSFKRYVGAQIGIHNLRGEKVGTVSHLRNKEFVYVVSRDDLSASLALMAQPEPHQLSLFDAEPACAAVDRP